MFIEVRTAKIATTVAAAAVALSLSAAPSSAAAYDYTNPQTTGCSSTGRAANAPYSTVNIYNPAIAGQVLGTVELRWSTGCLTNWSRVTLAANTSARGVRAWAYRPSDGANTWGHDGDGDTFWAASAYSDQLYGNGVQVCAAGQIAYQELGPIQYTKIFQYCY